MLFRCRAIVTFSIFVAGAGGVLACEKDEVLPSVVIPAMCGNGILEQGEQCDVASPGCIGCQIAPEWTCPGNVCSVNCSDPGVGQRGPYCTRNAACNMDGYWAVRETDYTAIGTAPCDSSSSLGCSTSTQWYLYHLSQSGSGSRYSIDTALDCGIHVTGLADVDYTPNTEEFLMYKSGIDGPPDGPRQGSAEEVSSGQCNVSLDRFYFIRGATSEFLPLKDKFDIDAALPPAANQEWLGAPALPAQPPGTQLAYQKNIPPGAVNTHGDAGPVYPAPNETTRATLRRGRSPPDRSPSPFLATTACKKACSPSPSASRSCSATSCR
jgi:hypothetical protein